MKKISLLLLSIVIISGCTLKSDSNNDIIIPPSQRSWHLINVYGGIQGVNNNFDLEEIIWKFYEDSGTVTVTNNNTNDNLEDGLDSGNYSYQLITNDNVNYYITINGAEYGHFSFTDSNTKIIIDQNKTSDNSTGADGFIYTLQEVVVYEE